MGIDYSLNIRLPVHTVVTLELLGDAGADFAGVKQRGRGVEFANDPAVIVGFSRNSDQITPPVRNSAISAAERPSQPP